MLGDGGIVVVCGNMRKVVEEAIKAIGPRSCPEVGPSEDHVKAERLSTLQKLLDLIRNELSSNTSPAEAPLSKPATVELPRKDQ